MQTSFFYPWTCLIRHVSITTVGKYNNTPVILLSQSAKVHKSVDKSKNLRKFRKKFAKKKTRPSGLASPWTNHVKRVSLVIEIPPMAGECEPLTVIL